MALLQDYARHTASFGSTTRNIPARPIVRPADNITSAMGLLEALTELAGDADNLKLAREAFELANTQLFLRFRKHQLKKRTVNKIDGGALTFGSAPPPIEIYNGPTARGKIKRSSATVAGNRVKPNTHHPPKVVLLPVRRVSRQEM